MNNLEKIRAFNTSVKNDKKALKPGWYLVSEDHISTHGCNVCRRALKKFGGTPHDGATTIFDATMAKMGDSIDFKVEDETRIIFLVPGQSSHEEVKLPGVGITRVCHLVMVAMVDQKHDFRNKFFGGRTITVGHVKELKNSMREWFRANIDVLYNLFAGLRVDVAKALATAINDLHTIMNLGTLEFMEWLSSNMMRASSVLKLYKMMLSMDEDKDIKLLTNMFDPEFCGMNMEEKAKKRTYGAAEVVLRWNEKCDLDMHVTGVSEKGYTFHVSYSNKSYSGIALDHDNTAGGLGSQEVVTFNPDILRKEGFIHITVKILMFSSFTRIKVPFEVTEKQHGFTNVFKGTWLPEKHGRGSDVKNACWSKTFELRESAKTIEVPFRNQLPDGFNLIDKKECEFTQCKTVILKAGHGTSVYALMRTPDGDFRHDVTALRIGGSYQLSHDVKCNQTCEFNGVQYASVGSSPLYNIPLTVMFIKPMFPFGQEGLKRAEKYRGKVYSPHPWWQVDGIFSDMRIPKRISWIILSYATEEQLVSLFVQLTERRSDGEENWWNAYM